jgi:hypothetical protein
LDSYKCIDFYIFPDKLVIEGELMAQIVKVKE